MEANLFRGLAAVLIGGLLSATATAAGVDDLAWLQGEWRSQTDDRWSEEVWTAPRGGMLLGLNRSGRGDAARAFEFMRIQAGDDGVPVFWGAPGGAPAVAFPMTRSGVDEVVFENPAHDFPTLIRYRRDGDRLTATVSGAGGEGELAWQWQRVR